MFAVIVICWEQILRGNKQQVLLQTPESPQIYVIQGPKISRLFIF